MKTTPHSVTPDEIMALMDGELSKERMDAVRIHLADCVSCTEIAGKIGRSNGLLGNWPVEEIPASTTDRIRSRLSARKVKPQDVNLDWRSLLGNRGILIAASVGGLIALFLAISTPNLLRSRVAANEASAVGCLRVLNTAAQAYIEKYGHYPVSLENFGPPRTGGPTEAAADLIDAVLAGGRKSGYFFIYRHVPDGAGDGYLINADPLDPGTSGRRHFSTDQTGLIRMNGAVLDNGAELTRRQPSEPNNPQSANHDGPMIAQTAELKLTVRNLDAARNSIDGILERHSGHIAQLSASSENNSQPAAIASLRVPNDQLAICIDELKALGRVLVESQRGEEITQQYVDLGARLSNARKTEARLNDVIEHRTGNVKEVLEAENESARVRGEIERMEADRKAMGKRVVFATILVTLTQEYSAQLQPPEPSTAARLRNAMIDGVRDAWESGLGLTVWLLSVLPTVALWALILFYPARRGWRRWRTLLAGA